MQSLYTITKFGVRYFCFDLGVFHVPFLICFFNLEVLSQVFKDGAYFCYCAYVLRIWRYSGFLWLVPSNTGIFLRGLKLSAESRTQQVLLVSKMKIRGNHTFFRDNKTSICKKKKRHALLCILVSFRTIVA